MVFDQVEALARRDALVGLGAGAGPISGPDALASKQGLASVVGEVVPAGINLEGVLCGDIKAGNVLRRPAVLCLERVGCGVAAGVEQVPALSCVLFAYINAHSVELPTRVVVVYETKTLASIQRGAALVGRVIRAEVNAGVVRVFAI